MLKIRYIIFLFWILLLCTILFFYNKYCLNTVHLRSMFILIKNALLIYFNQKDFRKHQKNLSYSVFKNLNFKLNVYGFKITDQPILYICNHSSWLDIFILKYLLPDVYSIAHTSLLEQLPVKEIRKIFKSVCKKSIIYYDHKSKESKKVIRRKMLKHFNKGKSLLIYPEGMAYPITGPRTFYPGSFEFATQNNILIQPITVKYKSDVTWGRKDENNSKLYQKHHGDLVANMNKCKEQKENIVNVTFHPLVNPINFKNHLNLKKYCEVIITDEWINQHNYKK